MPNWCNTEIHIIHDDTEKLNKLSDLISEWTSKDYCENGFGYNWLGNIVGNSGIAKWTDDFHTDSGESIRCRGSLIYYEVNGNSLNITTETAWGPMVRMWVLVCEKYLPGAQIYFTAEECGNCVYETNDPDYIGKYNIDIWDDPPEEFGDEESQYDIEEEYVVEFLQRVLKTDEKDIEKLLERANEELDWVGIHKWEEVQLDSVD